MIRYKYNVTFTDIKPVEVDNETVSFVTINGRRNAKKTDYEGYCETHEEARQALIDHWTKRRAAAQEQLDYCEEKIERSLKS